MRIRQLHDVQRIAMAMTIPVKPEAAGANNV
jgi:hypothetical protein